MLIEDQFRDTGYCETSLLLCVCPVNLDEMAALQFNRLTSHKSVQGEFCSLVWQVADGNRQAVHEAAGIFFMADLVIRA